MNIASYRVFVMMFMMALSLFMGKSALATWPHHHHHHHHGFYAGSYVTSSYGFGSYGLYSNYYGWSPYYTSFSRYPRSYVAVRPIVASRINCFPGAPYPYYTSFYYPSFYYPSFYSVPVQYNAPIIPFYPSYGDGYWLGLNDPIGSDVYATSDAITHVTVPVSKPYQPTWIKPAIELIDMMVQEGSAEEALLACQRLSDLNAELPSELYVRAIVLEAVTGGTVERLSHWIEKATASGSQLNESDLPFGNLRRYLSADSHVNIDSTLDHLALSAMESNRKAEILMAISVLLRLDGQSQRASQIAAAINGQHAEPLQTLVRNVAN